MKKKESTATIVSVLRRPSMYVMTPPKFHELKKLETNTHATCRQGDEGLISPPHPHSPPLKQ